MKKKVKLFSTIASLCLAVALMVFGVLAATNVEFNVTNKVSFTATANVKAKVWHTIEVDKCTQTGAKANTSEENPDLTIDGSERKEDSTTYEASITLGDVELVATSGATEQMTYSYTITIKNTATINDSYPYLKVEIIGKTVEYTQEAGYGIITTFGTEKNATEILTAGATKTYTVKITVDNSKTITNIDLGTNVKLVAQDNQNI